MSVNDILQVAILLTLLWIAIGIVMIAMVFRTVGSFFSAAPRNLNGRNYPWVIKMMAINIVAQTVVRYLGRKLR